MAAVTSLSGPWTSYIISRNFLISYLLCEQVMSIDDVNHKCKRIFQFFFHKVVQRLILIPPGWVYNTYTRLQEIDIQSSLDGSLYLGGVLSVLLVQLDLLSWDSVLSFQCYVLQVINQLRLTLWCTTVWEREGKMGTHLFFPHGGVLQSFYSLKNDIASFFLQKLQAPGYTGHLDE